MSPAAQNSWNTSIWEHYIDVTLVVANCFVLLLTSVVGITANVFVMFTVNRQKSLQTCNNALVVNLAVIDILRCTIDCPVLLAIVLILHQQGQVDELICDAQVAFFSFSCCVQLLTLACISAERYQAIAKPFKTQQQRRRVIVLIPLVWTLAIPVLALCVTFLKDSPVHLKCHTSDRETASSYDTFGLYLLLPLWATCFGVIIGFYTRIYTLVRAHNCKIFDKGTVLVLNTDQTKDNQREEAVIVVENGHEEIKQIQTQRKTVVQGELRDSSEKDSKAAVQPAAKGSLCLSVDMDANKELNGSVIKFGASNDETPSSLHAMEVEAELSNGYTIVIVRNSTAKSQSVSNSVDVTSQTEHNQKTNRSTSEMKETSHQDLLTVQSQSEACLTLLTDLKQVKDTSGKDAPALATGAEVSPLPQIPNNVPETEAAKQTPKTEGAVCMMPLANRERANKKKESKMAKRAGYIILSFLLFWLPLIISIIVNVIIYKNKNTHVRIIQDVEILSVSVSCMTSLSDPIIYAAVNPQFRAEFYRIKNSFKSMFIKK
ncbi:parietopsin [Thalassophryne amazonica]|uniref:parietopsin n=1 Tax=Thalassophryne amazonica TaxID=390379 RepID=UPI001470EA4B|nr:parietopsin [Thalassophryne amazonica]